jgi:flavin-dependent dehydrogenase
VTLKRDVLDALIVDAAVKQGAVFRVGAVTGIRQPSSDVVTAAIHDSDVELRARVMVVATGSDVTLLDQLGMVRRRKPSAIALRCYVRSEAEIDELVISFDRAIAPGYAWIFPLGDREYNVGCGVFFGRKGRPGVNLRQAFTRFVTETAVARPVMKAGSMATPIKGARLRAGLDGTVFDGPERIVPIGETIGTTYPFTGEGIGKAMETGALAAEQIHVALSKDVDWPLRQLTAKIERELAPKYRGYLVAQRWVSIPWLTDLLAARIRLDSALRENVAGVVNETADPRAVFTWRALASGWPRSGARSSGIKNREQP